MCVEDVRLGRLRDVAGLAWTAARDLGLPATRAPWGAAVCWLPLMGNLAGHLLARDLYCTPDRRTFVLAVDERRTTLRPSRFLGTAVTAGLYAAMIAAPFLLPSPCPSVPVSALVLVWIVVAEVVTGRRYARAEDDEMGVRGLRPKHRHWLLRRLTARNHARDDDAAFTVAVQGALARPGSVVVIVPADAEQSHRLRHEGFEPSRRYHDVVLWMPAFEPARAHPTWAEPATAPAGR